MSAAVDAIERTLEETRRSATQTAMALREKLAPKGLVREAMRAPGVRQAGEAVAIAVPLAIVIGAIVWLNRKR